MEIYMNKRTALWVIIGFAISAVIFTLMGTVQETADPITITHLDLNFMNLSAYTWGLHRFTDLLIVPLLFGVVSILFQRETNENEKLKKGDGHIMLLCGISFIGGIIALAVTWDSIDTASFPKNLRDILIIIPIIFAILSAIPTILCIISKDNEENLKTALFVGVMLMSIAALYTGMFFGGLISLGIMAVGIPTTYGIYASLSIIFSNAEEPVEVPTT